jgi:hypothetical protein
MGFGATPPAGHKAPPSTKTEKEPTDEEVLEYLRKNPTESFYSAREELRKRAYGRFIPDDHRSWGDYWITY